ncbi:glutamate 5-kinase [Arsukibacterium sp.]|uniref:glutamate 5-kinase n=1 Tax=Arsukibacterium sp. TaxID=1977258 RepID=UPI00299D85B6|nr:glutamate 5-kinase [Arsukibacterium sp.]MDX1677243.1 glutamate 5-kinase [Arsukibacterium sp.]
MAFSSWRRIVIKVGSALIAPAAHGCSTRYLLTIARFIAECRLAGKEVVLVSSGSVAAGRNAIVARQQPLPINVKQAMAAVGQSRMMACWSQLFDFDCAQILLTHDDLQHRRRYLNIDNTLRTLLANQILPIVNENDSVATAELKLGDNDNLAAMVAIVVDADVLIICSDIDGLYTANPRLAPEAHHISEVPEITPAIYNMAGGSHHAIGTGGMLTKIQAADKATKAGIDTLIINGQDAGSFEKLLGGTAAGTRFVRQQDRLSAKKHWLLNTLKQHGVLQVDAGAGIALQRNGASLLASGIISLTGNFDKGDALLITDPQQRPLAKGISQYSSQELNLIKGLHSKDIAAVLGCCPSEEVVHRNDLVLLN